MQIYHEGRSTTSIPFAAAADEVRETHNEVREERGRSLPEGWQKLSTGLKGARLYRVTPSGSNDVHWQAEMTLNGKVQRRRCASELYARWWLSGADDCHDTPNIFDGEERNERLRAGFAG